IRALCAGADAAARDHRRRPLVAACAGRRADRRPHRPRLGPEPDRGRIPRPRHRRGRHLGRDRDRRHPAHRALDQQLRLAAARPRAWLRAAFLPLLASQLAGLTQSEPLGWVVLDYAGRLAMLATLAVIPAARLVAFRPERLQVRLVEAALWIGNLLLCEP